MASPVYTCKQLMASSLPKLKGNLAISRQQTGGEQAFVVKDPSQGRFYRFREVEGFILERLDGACEWAQLQAELEVRFQTAVSVASLEKFVGKLAHLGLLEPTKTRTDLPNPPQNRRYRDPFYFRFKACNPDRLFARMAEAMPFFFAAPFVWLSGLTVAFACSLAVINWGEITREIRTLFHLQSLLVAWVTVILVIVAHEFAHGLTCKHFGGAVQELGFILIYFQPTFFCNVSDAWLFPEKWKRLWVSFAGAYFEIFLWALATVVWRLTDPHSFPNYIALVIMATSGIKTLFNFNPLIKLDGYYLLSDYLEIPNLRRKAFGYVSAQLKKFSGAAGTMTDKVTKREQRIYLAYGVLAAVYSYCLFTLIVLRLGGYLVNRYQAWGFAAFSGLLVVLFRSQIRSYPRRLASWWRSQKGMVGSLKRIVRSLVWLVPILALLWFCRLELKVAGEFVILPNQNAEIRTEVEGIIQEIKVDEGSWVKQGDLIIRISERDYRAELNKTGAEINERQAKLKLLRAGTRLEELDLAKTSITKAEERLKYGRNQLEMDRALLNQHLQSRREYELTEELVAVREQELEESKKKLNVLLAGSRVEEIEATEAEIHRLQAQQDLLNERLRLLAVTSPISGVITTPKLKEKLGQDIKKGELIAVVHELQTVTAEITINENEIADVHLGQKVMLKARAYPQKSFFGEVTAIAPMVDKPDETRPERKIRVRTRLANPQLLLKSEMSGHAKIYSGQRRMLELVDRRLVRYLRVEFWSWW